MKRSVRHQRLPCHSPVCVEAHIEVHTGELCCLAEEGLSRSGFRQPVHHENISFARLKDRERVFIKEPKLSALLTGTPNQILTLITDA